MDNSLDCKCKNMCCQKLSTTAITTIRESYSTLDNKKPGDVFLANLISNEEIKFRRPARKSDWKTKTTTYNIDYKGVLHKVCRVAFALIYGITQKKITIIRRKKETSLEYRNRKSKHEKITENKVGWQNTDSRSKANGENKKTDNNFFQPKVKMVNDPKKVKNLKVCEDDNDSSYGADLVFNDVITPEKQILKANNHKRKRQNNELADEKIKHKQPVTVPTLEFDLNSSDSNSKKEKTKMKRKKINKNTVADPALNNDIDISKIDCVNRSDDLALEIENKKTVADSTLDHDLHKSIKHSEKQKPKHENDIVISKVDNLVLETEKKKREHNKTVTDPALDNDLNSSDSNSKKQQLKPENHDILKVVLETKKRKKKHKLSVTEPSGDDDHTSSENKTWNEIDSSEVISVNLPEKLILKAKKKNLKHKQTVNELSVDEDVDDSISVKSNKYKKSFPSEVDEQNCSGNLPMKSKKNKKKHKQDATEYSFEFDQNISKTMPLEKKKKERKQQNSTWSDIDIAETDVNPTDNVSLKLKKHQRKHENNTRAEIDAPEVDYENRTDNLYSKTKKKKRSK